MTGLSVLIVLGGILSLGEADFTSTHVQSLVNLNDVLDALNRFDREGSGVNLQGLGNMADTFGQKNGEQTIKQVSNELKAVFVAIIREWWLDFASSVCESNLDEYVLKAINNTGVKKITFSNSLRSLSDRLEFVLSHCGHEVFSLYVRNLIQSFADVLDRIRQNGRHRSSIRALPNVLRDVFSEIPLVEDGFNSFLNLWADLLDIFDFFGHAFKFNDLQDISTALREVVSRYSNLSDFQDKILHFADLLDYYGHKYDSLEDFLQSMIPWFFKLYQSMIPNFFQIPFISKLLHQSHFSFTSDDILRKINQIFISIEQEIKQLSVPKEEVLAREEALHFTNAFYKQ